MENILLFIQTHLPILIEHKYLFIFIGVSIEGLNSTVLAGFLASVGAVSLWPAFFLCIAGQVLNCFGWYTVGYFAGSKPIDKWGRKDEKSRKIIEKVEGYFKRYSGRAIFIAHVTWSLTIATMIMAGSFKYDLKKFALYNFLGSTLWVLMVFFVGFFFGQSYKYLFDYLKNFFIILTFLGGAIAIGYLLKMVFRSAYIRSLFLADRIREINNRVKNGIDKFFWDYEDSGHEGGDLTKL